MLMTADSSFLKDRAAKNHSELKSNFWKMPAIPALPAILIGFENSTYKSITKLKPRRTSWKRRSTPRRAPAELAAN